MADDKNCIKILLVGESDVGKTSIFEKFLHNKFSEKISASTGVDFGGKKIKYKNMDYNIDLFDTAGQESFRDISKIYYANAHGIFVVFDLTNQNSFNSIQAWLEKIKENNPLAYIIFLGNKVDLKEKRIDMSKEDIEEELKQLKELEILKDLTNLVNNEIIYYEISAKKDKNITEAIKKMISLIKGISEDDVKKKTEGNADEQSEKTTCPCLHSCNLI